jgi:hypothetical protein
LKLPEVNEVSEVQELAGSVVSSLGPVMGREMKKEQVEEEVAEGVAKSESGEEVTTAERRGTLKNEKSGEEEVTTAERRGTLVCESDLVSLSSDASDARTQATRGNWIKRAGVVLARIVRSARRLATKYPAILPRSGG